MLLIYCLLQMSPAERPDEEMIRPCNCRGTIAYVHTDCLNNWRSTSQTDSCAQCHYVYQQNVPRQFTQFSTNLLKSGTDKLTPELVALCFAAWFWSAMLTMVLFWVLAGCPSRMEYIQQMWRESWFVARMLTIHLTLQAYYLMAVSVKLIIRDISFLPLPCCPWDKGAVTHVARRHISLGEYFQPALSESQEETFCQACLLHYKRGINPRQLRIVVYLLLISPLFATYPS